MVYENIPYKIPFLEFLNWNGILNSKKRRESRKEFMMGLIELINPFEEFVNLHLFFSFFTVYYSQSWLTFRRKYHLHNFDRIFCRSINFYNSSYRCENFDSWFYRSNNFINSSYRSYNFDVASRRSCNFDNFLCGSYNFDDTPYLSYNFDKTPIEVITSIKL
jgi:hypothetical protein